MKECTALKRVKFKKLFNRNLVNAVVLQHLLYTGCI